MIYPVVAFAGAFLLFTIELAAAKLLLPSFGGSSSVWVVSMMFFQGMLFLGYLYVHRILENLDEPWSSRLHIALLAVAGLALPVSLGTPPALSGHILRLTAALFAIVGLPFFVLSATTPLLHSWMERARGGRPGFPAYAMFAASNAGALSALLGYPFVFEPGMTLTAFLRLWAGGYAVFAAAHLFCMPAHAKRRERVAERPAAVRSRALWLLASAGPCAVLLAATNLLANDFAAAPLVWMLPLAVYLLTIILNFMPRPARLRRLSAAFIALTVFLLALYAVPATRDAVALLGRFLFILGALFVIGMVCHRVLVESRPSADEGSTEFYAWVAFGGWLGSALIAVILPWAAQGSGFLGVDWIAASLVSAGALVVRDWGRRRAAALLAVLCAAGGAVALASSKPGDRAAGRIYARRNFYGVYTVEEKDGLRMLYHGNTHHGMQFIDGERRRAPLSYFNTRSPLGDVFRLIDDRVVSVGAVGLGAGTVAAYAKPGDAFEFFELDPLVEALADRYFWYLKDSRARTSVFLGDARLGLRARGGARYDLLILDAFNNGTVPVHLLTDEAFELYESRLATGGFIAVHISNRYLDMAPLLAGLARSRGLHGAVRYGPKDADRAAGIIPSRWVVLSREGKVPARLVKDSGWRDLAAIAPAAPWTDEYSSILPLLRLAPAGR